MVILTFWAKPGHPILKLITCTFVVYEMLIEHQEGDMYQVRFSKFALTLE